MAMGGRVLVLNATYEPINVCTVRRAVVLLLKEKAELLERGRWELHSESSTLARPVVIRLVSYVKVPQDAHRRKITRRAVFARDSWTCQYCGSRSNLTVDHVIPRSKGGSSSWENIVALVRALQPAQGRPDAPAGGDASSTGPAHAACGDLHPGRQPDDTGGLAGIPAAGSLSSGRTVTHSEPRPAAAAEQRDGHARPQKREGRLHEGALRDAALAGKTESDERRPVGPAPAVVSGCPGLDSAKRSSLPT